MIAAPRPRPDLIFAEQVRALYGSTPAIAFGGFILPPFITALFWDMMDHSRSIVWVGLVWATSGMWATLLYRRFLRSNRLPHDTQRWLRHALVRSACSGLAWGLFIITDATASTTSQIVGGTSLIGFGAITV